MNPDAEVLVERQKDVEKILIKLSEKKMVFLLGAFGSGKSEVIKNLKKFNSHKPLWKRSRIKIINMSGCFSIKELYARSTSFFTAFIIFALISCLAGWIIATFEIEKIKNWIPVLTLSFAVFAAIFIAKDGYIVFYKLCENMERLAGFRRIIVLEDLDRVSITNKEIYNFLSTLHPQNNIIVTIDKKKLELDSSYFLDTILKLNGDFVTLETSGEIKYKVLVDQHPGLADLVSAGVWLDSFELRHWQKFFQDQKLKSSYQILSVEFLRTEGLILINSLYKEISKNYPTSLLSSIHVEFKGSPKVSVGFASQPKDSDEADKIKKIDSLISSCKYFSSYINLISSNDNTDTVLSRLLYHKIENLQKQLLENFK